MTDQSNLVLIELLNKKRNLVRQLLVESQRFLLEQNSLLQDHILYSRSKLIDQLQTTDHSISRWEKEVGKIAKEVENRLHEDIFRLFELIAENDENSLRLLEAEQQKLLQERKNLSKGNRVSGYLKHKRNFTSIGAFL
ncbi:MAG: hypothetical protein GY786_11310 [Proteobacteria bacterium]|nr:hypothetical protein [Pseudomonadota bacterium]